MKAYKKPEIIVTSLVLSEAVSSGLSEWLRSNELENAGITTYFVNS